MEPMWAWVVVTQASSNLSQFWWTEAQARTLGHYGNHAYYIKCYPSIRICSIIGRSLRTGDSGRRFFFFFFWFANDSTHESRELENSNFTWSWLWNTVTEGNSVSKQNLKHWARNFPFIWTSIWKEYRLMLIFKSFIEAWWTYNKLYISVLCNLINSCEIFVNLSPQSRMWTYQSLSNISVWPFVIFLPHPSPNTPPRKSLICYLSL